VKKSCTSWLDGRWCQPSAMIASTPPKVPASSSVAPAPAECPPRMTWENPCPRSCWTIWLAIPACCSWPTW